MEINEIYNVDCVVGMKQLNDGIVDLTITSPPYNVGIKYDTHVDTLEMVKYWDWTREWLTELYRITKDDGRVAINIPYEINVRDRGGRVFFTADFYQIMKEVGFKFFGVVDLEEASPHRSKTTAWGSFMSPSGPYIYNPKECVILGYKKNHIKKVKGEPEWKYVDTLIENEDGTTRNKRVYNDDDKKEFMELVFGQWKYFADTKSLTKATFSSDIPDKAMKILTYKNDLILDPFSGSGTTALSAKKLGRNYIGFELSENYANISRERIENLKEEIEVNKD
jgi:site-specific DNA-methyltransferase (adenine-specific)